MSSKSFTPRLFCHGCEQEIMRPKQGAMPVFARLIGLKRITETGGGLWSDGHYYQFPNACSPACWRKILDDPSWERLVVRP